MVMLFVLKLKRVPGAFIYKTNKGVGTLPWGMESFKIIFNLLLNLWFSES